MRIKHVVILGWITMVLLAITPILAWAQTSFELKDLIEAKPASGGAGEWVIGGLTVVANASTEFRTDKGPLNIGVCAEVEYIISGDQNVAKKITSKSVDDCTGTQTPTASTTATASSTTTATSTATPAPQEHKGLVEVKPANGVGAWIIGGQTFIADASTEFRTDKGPLNVGVCAEVEYHVGGGQNLAKKIASKSADDCGGASFFEHKGLLSDQPVSRMTGTWHIGGIAFEATASTEFRTDQGPLDLGVCAEVEYLVQNSQNIAKKIASKSADDCSSPSLQSIHGTFDVMPPNDLIGTWIVSGIDYVSTSSTVFEQADGPFNSGGCVEVEFVNQNGQLIAIEIKTDDTCGPGGTPEPGLLVARGILASFPAGLVGTWTVDGVNYTAASTEFSTQHGDFATGICVKVEYTQSGDTRTAREIETEPPSDCGSSGQVGELETKGRIDAMPVNGLIGDWTIAGELYAANAQTRFDQERGSFETGRCVEVEYRLNGGMRTATKIATKRQHDCSASQTNNEAFGFIGALPDSGTLGTWIIGGLPFVVNAATTLDDGPFVTGLLVEVHFTVATDGSLIATRIEGEQGVGVADQALAIAYGLIQSMPGGDFADTWEIGGNTYKASADTRFEQDEGAFMVGACAKVGYRVENNVNVAVKIETEPPGDCPSDNGTPINRTAGFVKQIPPNGFIGTWLIGGNAYEVNAATQLQEDHGVLGVGAFVKIQYTVQNDVRVAQEIETHVPPAAGNINTAGLLQTGNLRSPDSPSIVVWQIDGQPYTILDVTFLDDGQADFVDGQQVFVNAYEENSALIATRVTALGDGNIGYLPIVIR